MLKGQALAAMAAATLTLFVLPTASATAEGAGTRSGASAAAAAAEPAYLTRDIWLRNLDGSPAPEPASVTRRIYLAAGNYEWYDRVYESATGIRVTPENHRTIYLAAGWYDWTCTVLTKRLGDGLLAYYENCSLDQFGPAYLASTWWRPPAGSSGASYTFGGVLVPRPA
ncbi:hypothetical protein GCM10010222_26290 [Streptomyces tanashiensis]|nr:hypothetical protein GCM10010222_26290 [Streptomyces tanashiensis]